MWVFFVCLSSFCHIVLARLSNTMLNRSGEGRHPRFVLRIWLKLKNNNQNVGENVK